ncbi:MAG: NPCBM/NEW2 domain-containing protein [Planctomycetes bacterium]|nr:NPCBM/NEW2 domain-containing protein [Planctomycetota bacterium]
MISLLTALLLCPQEPLQVILEAPDGALVTHDLSSPLAAPLPEGVAFVRYSQPAAAPKAEAQSARVELLDGGRVMAQVIGGEGDFLDVSILGDARLRVSVDELSSVVIPERIPAAWGSRLEPSEEGDRLYRLAPRGLERLEGTLEEFTEAGVSFATSVGTKELPWTEVCALFIEALGDAPLVPPSGDLVVVDLADGGRVHAGLLEIREDEMDLVTRAGRGLRLKRSAVSELFVPGAGARYLSELTPVVVGPEGSPFGDGFGMVWPHRVDRSVTGGPLRCGGRLYTRGIGVHAPSKLQWELDGSWSTLKLAVGVDDEVLELGGQGSVVFRVLVDGESRFESELITGGQGPVAVPPVSLEGATLLSLEVEMASDLHVGDRADWLRPVLVR